MSESKTDGIYGARNIREFKGEVMFRGSIGRILLHLATGEDMEKADFVMELSCTGPGYLGDVSIKGSVDVAEFGKPVRVFMHYREDVFNGSVVEKNQLQSKAIEIILQQQTPDQIIGTFKEKEWKFCGSFSANATDKISVSP